MKNFSIGVRTFGLTFLVGMIIELALTTGAVYGIPLSKWHWFAIVMQIAYVITLIGVWLEIFDHIKNKTK